MILKARDYRPPESDPRLAAGMRAESQMSHYLSRAFGDDQTVFILNDLRLVDEARSPQPTSEDAAQIDHLVVHPWGIFIVESKSVTTEVRVQDQGAGDEWERIWKGQRHGIPSPIQQAKRQGEFIRDLLSRNNQALLGKMPLGLRTLAKIASGSEHRGFMNLPVQIIVAISDQGRITRVKGWKDPEKPFRTIVCKADQVCNWISEELGRHRSAASIIGKPQGSYGIWSMKKNEAESVARFLADQHATLPHRTTPTPRSADRGLSAPVVPSRPPVTAPLPEPVPLIAQDFAVACKHCASNRLIGNWGKFGPYWQCADCKKNTPMPETCTGCGKQGQKGRGVRIRRDGPTFVRQCEDCGAEVTFWTNPS